MACNLLLAFSPRTLYIRPTRFYEIRSKLQKKKKEESKLIRTVSFDLSVTEFGSEQSSTLL